ncbi:response regulator [Flavihumibacter sp. CACIAM 22H1]|uniref:response regulator n=1 Tax=Flavihumibacter sp. CACIAM 22H1 TaxID=1812911 RepID=UPI0007A8A649|nr:response regulator [Flavihumibacter sp. CACIAM 22H1]KYP15236.1 MAG: two-component system response regulator [Flavihumibacter sp. CACIAM 22H1]
MNKIYILVAEDDADDRFLLETAFAENGYEGKLQFVENGVELLDYLRNLKSQEAGADSHLPGFILLDLNMPKKDGREVLKELKEDPRFKKIPVVVFTTTKNENEINRCYELGANTYVVKPVGFENLVKTIDDIRSYWFKTAQIP